MENKKNIKRTILTIFIALILLVLGFSLNSILKRGPIISSFVSQNEIRPAFNSFYENVVPILDEHCSVCHGLNEEKYQNIKSSSSGADLLRWQTGGTGRVESIQLGQQLYDDLVIGNGKHSFFDYETYPVESPLLRAGLAKKFSGGYHFEVFNSSDDNDYQVLRNWIEDFHEKVVEDVVEQSESEMFFTDKVVPVLVRKNCFGCHGPMAFNDLRLDAGIPMLEGRFTPAIHRHNRKAMLGKKSTRMVHLSGDVEQSKQLLKNIPVEQGGMVHLGGNNFFEKDDPDYQILLQWLELEKEEVVQKYGLAFGQMDGIIYVQRPDASPERFFEDDDFLPGADIFWLKDDEVTNLTSSLHPEGPADFRAPDVSYDARSIVFSMRKNESEAFNIWELDLESGDARQITFSEDAELHFKDPLYIPNPERKAKNEGDKFALAFVSNMAGEYCQSSPEAILGEAEEGSSVQIIDIQRKEKAGTFNGQTITIVRGTNEGEVRKIASYTPGKIIVSKAFSKPCNSSTHYEIESKARMAPKYDGYRMHLSEKGKEKQTFEKTLTRMTYSVSQIRRPTMRSTGEIMFTALRTGYQNDRVFFNGALFRTHVDGSNLHTHNGNRSGIPIFADDREMPNGLEVRIGRDADSYWGGMLILSDHQFGPSIENYNPTDDLDHPYQNGMPESSKVRFVPGWISLDSLVAYGGVSEGGVYRDPYPLPDGSILVSYAKGPVDLHDPNANPDFDVLKLSPDPAFQSPDGFNFGDIKPEVLSGGTGAQLSARPVTPRLVEPTFKKLKTDPDVFGSPLKRAGFTQYPDSVEGTLMVSDLILLEAFFKEITTVGDKHISSSDVKFARVIGAQPQHKGDSGQLKRFIIAEVPIEEDGSFYVKVPSKTSFDIQALNQHRMAISSPNRWLYCQPGEKHSLSTPKHLFAQSCAGCHGSLTGIKEDVLRRPDGISGASRTLSYWNEEDQQFLLPKDNAITNESGIQFISYEKDIAPIVQRKCVSCHKDGELNLSLDKGYGSLIKYIEHREGRAVKSSLIEQLMGKEFPSVHNLGQDLPHPSENALTAEEMITFIRWIDLGALQFHESKSNE